MRAHDPQRWAVYAAESQVWWGERFADEQTLEEYIAHVLRSPFWLRHRPQVSHVALVEPTSRLRASVLYAEGEFRFSLPESMRSARFVLHELAHVLSPQEPYHGPRFAQFYLQLVASFMGETHGRHLRERFDRLGVVFLPPGAVAFPGDGTPTQ